MSLELCVLGSGSSGNATVLKTPRGSMLLDAGFGPRVTAQRLAAVGLALPQVTAICLTHLDHDHFNRNWFATLLKQQITIHCHASLIPDLLALAQEAGAATSAGPTRYAAVASLLRPFDAAHFEPLPGLAFAPIHLAHDAEGSHGFLIHTPDHRVGYATDLGHVPDTLIDLFCGVDLLALESNYDTAMEENSDRPWYLKQRIMGGRGHLSNDQALAAVRRILDLTHQRCGPDRLPRHIVLLHRSRQCNCPRLLRRLFEQDARIAPILTLADQSTPTGWLRVRREKPYVGRRPRWRGRDLGT